MFVYTKSTKKCIIQKYKHFCKSTKIQKVQKRLYNYTKIFVKSTKIQKSANMFVYTKIQKYKNVCTTP